MFLSLCSDNTDKLNARDLLTAVRWDSTKPESLPLKAFIAELEILRRSVEVLVKNKQLV